MVVRPTLIADEEFVARWRSDAMIDDVAAHYGLTVPALRSFAARAGLPRRGARIPPKLKSPSQVDKVLFEKMWRAGDAIGEITDACGCSKAVVYVLRRALDLPSRRKESHAVTFSRQQVRAVWFKPISNREMCALLGISHRSLEKLVGAYDLPPRRGFTRMKSEAAVRARYDKPKLTGAPKSDAPSARPAKRAERIGGAPFWTPARDAIVRETQGRYAALRAAADRLSQPVSRVQARWHRLAVA